MNENKKKITTTFLISELAQSRGDYGYSVYLGKGIHKHDYLWRCAVEIFKVEPPPYKPPTSNGYIEGDNSPETKMATDIYPLACDILWQLCLRGILRPGVRFVGGQSVTDGQGYSLTLKGEIWVKSPPDEDIQEILQAL
jgi:hypothetical protein